MRSARVKQMRAQRNEESLRKHLHRWHALMLRNKQLRADARAMAAAKTGQWWRTCRREARRVREGRSG